MRLLPPRNTNGSRPTSSRSFYVVRSHIVQILVHVPRTRINLSTQVYTNIAHTRNTNAHRDNEADCDLRHILKNDSPANCGPDHQRTNEKQDVADVAIKTATRDTPVSLEISSQTACVAEGYHALKNSCYGTFAHHCNEKYRS